LSRHDRRNRAETKSFSHIIFFSQSRTLQRPPKQVLILSPKSIGGILTLPPERGRSPPAARRSVEVVWNFPEPFHQLCCCGPGRSAVRRWRCQATQSLGRRKMPPTQSARFVAATTFLRLARRGVAADFRTFG